MTVVDQLCSFSRVIIIWDALNDHGYFYDTEAQDGYGPRGPDLRHESILGFELPYHSVSSYVFRSENHIRRQTTKNLRHLTTYLEPYCRCLIRVYPLWI